MRVSLDAAEPSTFKMVRGLDMFDRIVVNVRAFTKMQREMSIDKPQLSLWLTGQSSACTRL